MEPTVNFQGQKTTADFRLFLKEILADRCRSNPAYSLRAFAKSLEVEPSLLSKLMSGRRRLSEKMFFRLAEKLELSATEMSQFDVEPIYRSRKSDPIQQDLSVEVFKVISDWYHYAILELTATKSFTGDLDWIARVLGISKSEVREAVDRLLRLNLLKIHPNGRWEDLAGTTATPEDGNTDTARMRLQRQMLEKSLIALQKLPKTEREHSSLTMAVNPEHIPKVKQMIVTFRDQLWNVLSQGPQTEVFHFQCSLYPVSQIDQKEEVS